MGLQEQIDEQPLDRGRVMADLVVARRLRPAQFQPVQRRLARQRRAIRPPRLELAGQHRQHRVVPQLVVVVQVLVTERDAEHPLRHHRADTVLHQLRHPRVAEARGKTLDQTDRPIRRRPAAAHPRPT